MYDLIIKNAQIPNFRTGTFESLDIGVKGGIIQALEPKLHEAVTIIDAQHKVVSPGFVDIHMHEEILFNTEDGDAYDIANRMLLMGATTCVGGNCGNLRQSIKDFFSYIDQEGAPVNYIMNTGHNFYRHQLGISPYEKPTPEQVLAMNKSVTEDLLFQGAHGLSYGIEYSPAIEMDEIMGVLKDLDQYDVLLSAHYRSDAKEGVEAVAEMIEIARLSGMRFQVSHLGSCTAMGQMEESLELIRQARAEGLDIEADCYPYDAFSTRIGTSVFDEGCFENWEKDHSAILLTEEPYKNMRCTPELFEKVRREHPDMLVVAFVMNEEEVIKAIKEPYCLIASDGLLARGQGHPRAAGSFPRVLARFVREMEVMSLIEALEKMTRLPARRLQLDTKGDIQVGMDADFVIFDPETITDGATFMEPTLPPTGIDYVLIGGRVAVDHGTIVQARLGKAMRKTHVKNKEAS